METPRGYLNLEHAALYTDTPVPTLREKVRLRELRAFKPAKRILFRVADLDAWMERHKILAPTLK